MVMSVVAACCYLALHDIARGALPSTRHRAHHLCFCFNPPSHARRRHRCGASWHERRACIFTNAAEESSPDKTAPMLEPPEEEEMKTARRVPEEKEEKDRRDDEGTLSNARLPHQQRLEQEDEDHRAAQQLQKRCDREEARCNKEAQRNEEEELKAALSDSVVTSHACAQASVLAEASLLNDSLLIFLIMPIITQVLSTEASTQFIKVLSDEQYNDADTFHEDDLVGVCEI